MANFRAWFEPASWPKSVTEMVTKLWNRADQYAVSYNHPGCHRTSNLVDSVDESVNALSLSRSGTPWSSAIEWTQAAGLGSTQQLSALCPSQWASLWLSKSSAST